MGPDRLICGVDEAGRGPLAGPVFAAAVVFRPGTRIRGLDDSKKLAEPARVALAEETRHRALAWAVASASVEEIDRLNILRATLLAMRRAVEALAVTPHEVWVDGLHVPVLPIPARAIVRGDARFRAISAASVLAKTDRDAEMVRLHGEFPAYGFDRHKGYPTPDHVAALQRHGACRVHRVSFAPVREALALASLRQAELF